MKFLFLITTLFCLSTFAAGNFKVAAFNIKQFGPTKAGNPIVMAQLTTLIKDYDVVLIQEVRDVSESAPSALLNSINNAVTGAPFSMLITLPLGRSTYKEQYVLFYRHDKLTLKPSSQIIAGWYVYDDGIEPNDTFMREPLIAHFQSLDTNLDFVVIGAHIDPDTNQPSRTIAELDELFFVQLNALTTFGDNDILMMGDFNADCSYLSDTEEAQLLLKINSGFHWLIDKTADTTVRASTHCAYDRFIASDSFFSKLVPNSVHIQNFQTTLGLTNEVEALAVSDHYPIELDIQNENTTGINSQGEDKKITLYPNPLLKNQNIHILLGESAIGNELEVQIFNISGKRLLNISVNAFERKIILSTENFPKGQYFMKGIDKLGLTFIKSFTIF